MILRGIRVSSVATRRYSGLDLPDNETDFSRDGLFNTLRSERWANLLSVWDGDIESCDRAEEARTERRWRMHRLPFPSQRR